MDAKTIGRTARSLEALHSCGYFSPDMEEEISGLGLRGRATYFVPRAAPMGPVSPGTVTATFFNFHPGLVAHAMQGVWETTTPAEAIAARFRGIDATYRRLLGEEVLASEEMAEAATLARRAAEACTPEGRPLYAGHADLAWPEEPHLVFWHALSLLREHRGDGHVGVLVAAGLSGVEALASHTASGRGFVPDMARRSRGWSEEEWAAAFRSLADHGLADEAGELTDDGLAMRREVEASTDNAGAGPWLALGEQDTTRLAELAGPMVKRALASGAFPEGIFATR